MALVPETFHGVAEDISRCFVADTIGGHGLPPADHRHSHVGLLTPDRPADFQASPRIAEGHK